MKDGSMLETTNW